MRLTPLIILISFLVLIPVISFAKCINLENFREASLIQVSDKILLDESRQIIFRKDKVALSIVRFNKPSTNQSNVRGPTAADRATIFPTLHLKIKSEYQIAPVTLKRKIEGIKDNYF